jgi:hypothetical protein
VNTADAVNRDAMARTTAPIAVANRRRRRDKTDGVRNLASMGVSLL